jgi:hypothetical protein
MSDTSRSMSSYGNCTICGKHEYVQPLHGDKGGPFCCILCAGKWHGEHGRRRRLGRVVIRAIAAYLNGGGKWTDIELLRLSAAGPRFSDLAWLDPLGYLADAAKLGNESIDLTSELLADAIKIAHPDLHPPERRELAHKVTQGLVALQPFVFPAEKPKPVQPSTPSSVARASRAPSSGPEPKRYPCKECAADVPYFYCADCRPEWERRQQKERERESVNRRRQYLMRKSRRLFRMPPKLCPCGLDIKSKRKDARFCSATCRQRAHRNVTDKGSIDTNQQNIRDRANDGMRSASLQSL